jgi:hypothetical protein
MLQLDLYHETVAKMISHARNHGGEVLRVYSYVDGSIEKFGQKGIFVYIEVSNETGTEEIGEFVSVNQNENLDVERLAHSVLYTLAYELDALIGNEMIGGIPQLQLYHEKRKN